MTEPRKILLGNFDGSVNALVVPAAVIKSANAAFDAERRKREMLRRNAVRGFDRAKLVIVFKSILASCLVSDIVPSQVYHSGSFGAFPSYFASEENS